MNPVNGINVRIYFLARDENFTHRFVPVPTEIEQKTMAIAISRRTVSWWSGRILGIPKAISREGIQRKRQFDAPSNPACMKSAESLQGTGRDTVQTMCLVIHAFVRRVLITGRGLFGLIEYDIPSSFLFLPSLPILEANEKRCTRQTHWITFLCVNLWDTQISQIVWDTYVISYRWNEDPTQAETGSPIPNLVTFSTITTTSPPNFPRNLKTGKRVNHPSLPHPRRNDLKRSGQRVFSKQDTKDIHKIKGRKSWRELKVIPTLSLSPSCTPPRESGGSCSLALLKEASLTPERGETAHRGLEREKEGGRERGWTTESLCTCDEETERPRWAFLGY